DALEEQGSSYSPGLHYRRSENPSKLYSFGGRMHIGLSASTPPSLTLEVGSQHN
ncbi:hypothetical protein HispidOSU_030277, partial [Sigmodon hispidus]